METICRTGIFIICAQVLIHFRPKASYDRYLKMLVSAMILIQLFLPVSALFTGEGEGTLAERVAWFQEELSLRMDEAARSYEEDFVNPEELEEIQSGLELWDGNVNSAEQEEGTDLFVTPIAPVNKIQISIGKNSIEEGDETNADISAGDHY